MNLIWIVVLPVLGFGLWVRLAPSDPARWHVMPESVSDKDFAAGAMRSVVAGPDALARLDGVARQWPRTRVLAGSVEEGVITYVTRTAVWGFPDYTSVRQVGGRLEIYARLRFGRRDMGVNRARVEAWLAQL